MLAFCGIQNVFCCCVEVLWGFFYFIVVLLLLLLLLIDQLLPFPLMIWPLLLFFNSYPFCCTVIFILLPLLLTFPLPLTISLSILCSSTSLTNYAYLVTSSYVNGFSKCLLNFTSIGRSLIFVYIPVQTSQFEYTLNYPSLVNIIYVGWLFENYSMIDPMMTSYLKLYAGCLHNGHSQRGLALVEVRIKKLFRSKH